MAQFFFDIDDGKQKQIDPTGLDLPDIAHARHEAMIAIIDIARESFADGLGGRIAIGVRDVDRHLVFTATLALDCMVFAHEEHV